MFHTTSFFAKQIGRKSIFIRAKSLIIMRNRSFLSNLKSYTGPTRTEMDTLGEIQVPSSCLWGAQTQRYTKILVLLYSNVIFYRSMTNFQIGDEAELMPKEIIRAMATIKKAAARVNAELNGLPSEISIAIQAAADEVSLISFYCIVKFP